MEENQIQTQSLQEQNLEPTFVDNSGIESANLNNPAAHSVQEDGQSYQQDPSENLILGKFKNTDELAKAYTELQRFQGENSKELGELRKESSAMNSLKNSLEQCLNLSDRVAKSIAQARDKYDKPEYFQEPTFRNLYREAVIVLGENLDSDKFIELLESYVKSRISAYDKHKSAQKETQQVLNSMTYQKNSKTSFTSPMKHFDEMTPQEIDELLEKLI